jgi:hypothetical protein
MDEHILAAAFRRDKSKALCGVEELHCSDGHLIVPVIGFHAGNMPTQRE